MSDVPSPKARARQQNPLTPVVRGALSDRVIEQLRARITDGTWPLNHRLPVESELATNLGVGRSTVREAVRVLVHTGLLEVRQGDGTYVRSRREIDAALKQRLTDANLLEIYELRGVLEAAAARLAAQRRSDADAEHLGDLLKRRAAAYAQGSQSYRKADTALQEQIVDVAHNSLLADLYRGISQRSRAVSANGLDDTALTLEGPEGPHLDDLVHAIANRDPDAAALAAARRTDNALRVLRFWLQVLIVEPGRPTSSPRPSDGQ